MLSWLLLFAGVNLVVALAVTLRARVRRPRPARWLLLAAVPSLWAFGALVTFFYFRTTIPPSPLISGPSGHLVVGHGNVDLLLWDERLSMAVGVALWLTVATLLGLVVLELARNRRAHQRRDRTA